MSLVCLCSFFQAIAQDAIFSQYYASSLYLNPALAGLQPDISLSTNYRTQWNNISPYTTGQASLIYPFMNKNKPSHEHWGGAGLSVFQDKAGENGSYQVLGGNVNLAYNVSLGSRKLQLISFGLQAGFIQQKTNPDNYEWGTRYTTGNNGFDPSLPDANSKISATKLYPDIGAGAIWYFNNSKKYTVRKFSSFIGLSAYHLNKPDQSMVQAKAIHLPTLLKAHGGIEFPISEKMRLSPNAIVALQNQVYQYNAGMYLSYRIIDAETGLFAHTDFILGGWYRVKDAVIFSTGLASRYLTIGFSYDMNNSALRSYTKGKGAYEVSLSFRIPRSLKLLRYDTPRI